jgi:hypothetical protein
VPSWCHWSMVSRGTLSSAATSSVVKVRSASAPATSPDSGTSTGAISVGANSFYFRASYAEAPKLGGRTSPVRITLPDGEVVSDDRADVEQILSRAFGRDIAFVEAWVEQMASGVAEEYWPDMAGLEYRDTVTDLEMPAGTFFDIAVLHLLTTSTIDRLRELYPQGRIAARRFRPNIVVSIAARKPDSWKTTGSAAPSSSATLFAWPSPNHARVA